MDYGYHAFMLVAASFVILMTAPGLALFYGGMSRSKSVLNMMMMSFGTIGIAGIVYVLWGWSMSLRHRGHRHDLRQPVRDLRPLRYRRARATSSSASS